MGVRIGPAVGFALSFAVVGACSGPMPDAPDADAGVILDASPPAPDAAVPADAAPAADAAAGSPSGAGSNSVYLSLAADRVVSGKTVLLSTPLILPTPDVVLLHADGRYGPTSAADAASVHVEVDGVPESNDAVIDWRSSTNAQQHCFNVIGAVTIPAGAHTVALVAEPIAGAFYVGAGSNLSVMTHPARDVQVQALSADSAELDFTTMGIEPGTPVPHTPLLAVAESFAGEDTIALGAAREFYGTGYGDAMMGLFLDGQNPGNGAALWSVNDTWTGAETQAPLATHAFLAGLNGSHTVSFDASEFPWAPSTEDGVRYHVGAGSRLVVLHGGLNVRGRAPAAADGDVNDTQAYVGVGTDQGWPAVPNVGTDVSLAAADFEVPVGHSGVVLFLAKTRIQGDSADKGGTASLWIALDGKRVGAVGIQQLAAPDSVSERTLTASYLAAGTAALRSGPHHVQVFGRADGSFIHLAMLKDLPLLWFD